MLDRASHYHDVEISRVSNNGLAGPRAEETVFQPPLVEMRDEITVVASNARYEPAGPMFSMMMEFARGVWYVCILSGIACISQGAKEVELEAVFGMFALVSSSTRIPAYLASI